jgi:ELWxxDGT repeat protein
MTFVITPVLLSQFLFIFIYSSYPLNPFSMLRFLLFSLLYIFSGMAAISQLPILVKDINPGAESSLPYFFTPSEDSLLWFTADDGVFGTEIWRSNGTESGTFMVKDIVQGFSFPTHLIAAPGRLYFNLNFSGLGEELWTSDGAEAGTMIVKDIRPGSASSNPNFHCNLGATLLFSANAPNLGHELWKTDGTEAGTVLVKNINAGNGDSYPSYLTNVDGTVFFWADDGVHGDELWKSDGTEAGTVLVKDINPGPMGSNPNNLVSFKGKLFFNATDGAKGPELWVSDGTEAGTMLLSDINPGANGSDPSMFRPFDDSLLWFRANNGATGTELFISDGSSGGTKLVKDIRPGATGSDLNHLTLVNGTLFFSAFDADVSFAGHELWKSDGTEAGTVLVKDIYPGILDSDPDWLINANGTLYFQADDDTHGVELWKSDGTEAGTVMVLDMWLGAQSSGPTQLVMLNGNLFFTASDGQIGSELWMIPDVPSNVADKPEAPIWNIFPNPASTTATVRLPAGYSGNVELYDALGRLVRQAPAKNAQLVQLDLDGLQPGLFAVRLSNLPAAPAHKLMIIGN